MFGYRTRRGIDAWWCMAECSEDGRRPDGDFAKRKGRLACSLLFIFSNFLVGSSSSTHLSELFAISQDIMIITLVHSRPQQSCDHDSHASYISGPPSNSNRSPPGVRIGIYPPLSLCIGCPSLPPNESSSEKNRRSQNATG